MKKALAVAVILGVIGVGGYMAYSKGVLPGAPKRVALPADTPVSLVLLDTLESGGSKVGDMVHLIVSRDVTAPSGEIVIPKGSKATGKVTWSRSQSVVSAFANEPARLAIKLDTIVTREGDSVPLKVDTGSDYHLTRENTGRTNFLDKLQQIWSSPEERAKLDKVVDSLKKGVDLSDSGQRNTLSQNARDLGLDALADTLSGDKWKDLQSTADDLKTQVDDIRKLSGGELLMAAMQYQTLLGNLGSTLEGAVKGRNIRAFPGTEVPAKVAGTQSLRVAK